MADYGISTKKVVGFVFEIIILYLFIYCLFTLGFLPVLQSLQLFLNLGEKAQNKMTGQGEHLRSRTISALASFSGTVSEANDTGSTLLVSHSASPVRVI